MVRRRWLDFCDPCLDIGWSGRCPRVQNLPISVHKKSRLLRGDSCGEVSGMLGAIGGGIGKCDAQPICARPVADGDPTFDLPDIANPLGATSSAAAGAVSVEFDQGVAERRHLRERRAQACCGQRLRDRNWDGVTPK